MVMPVDNIRGVIDLSDITVDGDIVATNFFSHRPQDGGVHHWVMTALFQT